MYLDNIKTQRLKKRKLIICVALVIFSCQEDFNLLDNPNSQTSIGEVTPLDDYFPMDNQNSETYVGNVILLTQEEVDNFGMLGYDAIDGSLDIGYNNFIGIDIQSNISDLQPLSQLNSISGYLSVSNNFGLTSLLGLDTITSVGDYLNLNSNGIFEIELNPNLTIGGGIYITQNYFLQSSNFFQNVTSINGTLFLWDGQFNSLGFTNLNSISGSLIIDSTSMTSLSEFSNLNSIGSSLSIYGNNNLNSLVGLEGITNINSLFQLVGNNALVSLEGLNNLTSLSGLSNITTNLSLTSLDGLENLSLAQDIYIGRNSSGAILPSQDLLTDFCALNNLALNGNYNSITIENNGYNPTVEDIVNGNCSQ